MCSRLLQPSTMTSPPTRKTITTELVMADILALKGVVINIVTEDRRTSWDMETIYNTTIEDMPLDVANLI